MISVAVIVVVKAIFAVTAEIRPVTGFPIQLLKRISIFAVIVAVVVVASFVILDDKTVAIAVAVTVVVGYIEDVIVQGVAVAAVSIDVAAVSGSAVGIAIVGRISRVLVPGGI